MPWLDLFSDAVSFDESRGIYRISGDGDDDDEAEDESSLWEDVLYGELADPGHVGEM
jgi:hypothetical protein